jgi:endonuclease/exonuclease/phosphatase (EEP) superfamily protein YafD
VIGPRFRLITANLYNDRADAEAFARLVESVEPDVVAVQELGLAQAEALASVLPFGRLDPARDHSGMGIALRKPDPTIELPLPHFSGGIARLTLPDSRTVEIVNVHILAPHVSPPWRTLRTRHRQVGALREYLRGAAPGARALVGDLNATPVWPAYRRLVAGFTDAAVEAARGNGGRPALTWGLWPGGRRLLRLDHVFVTGLVALGARVAELPGSDHDALIVDLALPPTA